MKSLSDKSLAKIARKMGMPFLAKPPIDYSESFAGVKEYPGFHTTNSFDIAASYAVTRVAGSFTHPDNQGGYTVSDYPVVISVDMTGFTPKVDFDAVNFIMPVLKQHLDSVIDYSNLADDSSDEEVKQAIYMFVDSEEETEFSPDYDVIQSLMYNSMQNFSNPLMLLADNEDIGYIVRGYISTGEIPEEVLIEATNQFRYEEDVDEDNLMEVWYITPVLEDPNEDDEEDEPFSVPGFDVVSHNDIYSGYSFNSSKVWDKQSGNSMVAYRKKSQDSRIQYHGTTYLRLISAAPAMEDVLPKPPSPPFEE